MGRKIFVNLPIADMQRSRRFFEALGFGFNPQFTNEQGACMVIADDICAMLLVQPFFQTFTRKRIADALSVAEYRRTGIDTRPKLMERVAIERVAMGVPSAAHGRRGRGRDVSDGRPPRGRKGRDLGLRPG